MYESHHRLSLCDVIAVVQLIQKDVPTMRCPLVKQFDAAYDIIYHLFK